MKIKHTWTDHSEWVTDVWDENGYSRWPGRLTYEQFKCRRRK